MEIAGITAVITLTRDGTLNTMISTTRGILNTNLAAVTLADGNMAIGIGRKDGVLRLWLP